MASWTDPSRQYLITSIRDRPVIWDKNYIGEANYRTLKQSAFEDVTSSLNRLFPGNFSWEEVRSQWKNLKDTFVRKLRWVHEGKYMEDAIKEPTWKFYRMLTFLDEKEAKRLGDTCETTYELVPVQRHPLSYEATSSADQMLQLFNSPPDLTQQQSMLPMPCGSSADIKMVTSSTGSKRMHYEADNGSSSDGVEEEDEDAEPGRKKPYRRQISSIPPMQVITTTASPTQQDVFDHFGGLIASTLRRIAVERGHASATLIQNSLYNQLFSQANQ
uniref:MADF domain-containing protein n=1 Tax=Caenorhabditis tropicalis TaxID=1561998 RepID=A0A1I7USZ8_9PELO